MLENTHAPCLLLKATGFLAGLELRLRMSQCEISLTLLPTRATTPRILSTMANVGTQFLHGIFTECLEYDKDCSIS